MSHWLLIAYSYWAGFFSAFFDQLLEAGRVPVPQQPAVDKTPLGFLAPPPVFPQLDPG